MKEHGHNRRWNFIIYTQVRQCHFYLLFIFILRLNWLLNSRDKMKWSALSVALALVAPSQAGLRFGCSTLSIQRLDPLVEPGNVPSAHLHQIVGGNVFAPTMPDNKSAVAIGDKGSCTTCFFSEDFSNYWTAVLYFKARNGTYKRVPIYDNTALEGDLNGGMTVYYTQVDFNTNGKDKITAFKPVSLLIRVCEFCKLTTSGFPHDCWQPNNQLKEQGSARPPIHLPSNKID